jgi:predicted TIM-barrel fold metal-dependent hydrolase
MTRSAPRRDEPVVIVSSDTHIGPRLVADLRPYCPRRLLDAFDEFAGRVQQHRDAVFESLPGRESAGLGRNRATDGHFDMHARLRDLDYDGVAAEIVFHGSQNEEPMPWGTFVAMLGPASDDLTLVGEGRRIYNRWLADAVSVEPSRHVGLAHLTLWDVEASVLEVERCRASGLRGVNLPAPRPGLAPYNDPTWEPLWAACAALEMPLTTHAGAGDPADWSGREAMVLMTLESGGWFSRRAIHQMVFGGVFERHPGLRLVLTEQPGTWWSATMRELDSAYATFGALLGPDVARRPSEYCRTNVFVGASFLAPFEADDAVREGYADNVMWGSDYPHTEGTFQFPVADDEPSIGRMALRNTFAGCADDDIVRMAGANAIRVYGLDRDALQDVATQIDAPTLAELTAPIPAVPAGAGVFAFRSMGPWA